MSYPQGPQGQYYGYPPPTPPPNTSNTVARAIATGCILVTLVGVYEVTRNSNQRTECTQWGGYPAWDESMTVLRTNPSEDIQHEPVWCTGGILYTMCVQKREDCYCAEVVNRRNAAQHHLADSVVSCRPTRTLWCFMDSRRNYQCTFSESGCNLAVEGERRRGRETLSYCTERYAR